MESNFSGMVNGFEYYDVGFLPNQNPNLGFGVPSSSDFDLRLDHWVPATQQDQGFDLHHQQQYSPPADEIDSENTLLKYVNQLLMEGTLAEEQTTFYDSLALRQTEQMLQQVISDSQAQSTYTIPANSITSSSTTGGGSSYWSSTSNSSVGGQVLYDDDAVGDSGVISFQGPNTLRGFTQPTSEILVRSMFTDTDSVNQFKRGLEEASKFLPNTDQWIFNPDHEVKEERGLSARKNRHRREEEEEDLEEARSSKQSALTVVEDIKLTELFDKVLLLDGESDPQVIEEGDSVSSKPQVAKKEGGRTKKKSQTFDFRTLLTLCAQSISAGDKITADDLLRQIRKQCTPLGDASQRLAYFFANALQARLEGSSGSTIQSYYDSIASKKRTAAQTLKSYHVFLSASPFMTLMYFYSNKMILDAAKDASVLHVIDFGILYGFQWPMFIQNISKSKTGPRKLRITGVEIPQNGFRPTERIDDTGRRLTEYCKRFGVPFEYNAIASRNWETIRLEEFKIRPNEVLAVNTALRLKNLRDVTPGGEEDCPRDAFLKLIRDMKPDVFLSSTVNGSFNAPFFTTRFKEALFHYSSLLDMFGSTLSKENPERIHFEGEFYGREVMNVIACEGVDRVERPETYKQWQVRMMRAGFKQKPVEGELVESFRVKMKKWGYHKNFVLDEDSNWFLQGWKGRILFSSSCWVPS
ncbi:hypothetical protein HID58_064234 [Brassica napus]|uniref:(rape) hypothetical protein n=1 Tax=Brassica napus TaxID=3708 RepID=A0A816KNF2_BRANA|nr:scarecrow-like protein 31 [Brassica napus]KAH0876840.1 hypothetical protein HID58_064234 [Brassica napus]CAF1924096.1 unnamed protein product [Brassica napus]